ncbi:hypothetical protein FB45DRAFT_1037878 [Roridomyces roridus]|uniref:Uncharacterized protein n=1 Tax=Roridomyces roridus TaxID=1738132 RepID=A0AAD7B562_9AGAR|nr:hypothetical protein FB45DRAFT_1037878 [Roridomyces roridus]
MSTSSNPRIPQPWENNAPHFDSDKPKELQQFLDHMDALMSLAGTAADKKKEKLVSYADYTAKREWQSLPSFTTGTKEKLSETQLDTIAEIASGVAYKLKAPIDEFREAGIKAIIDAVKSVKIEIPLQDLIAAAPEIQKEAKNLVTWRRVPVPETRDTTPVVPGDALPGNVYHSGSQYIQSDAIHTQEITMLQNFYVAEEQDGLVPKGALVACDPVLEYLSTLKPGERAKQIFATMVDPAVALDSAALRVVYPLIKGVGQAESILDNGSQIVSMAMATAIELGVEWNPDINIMMQSANGQVEKTEGLARNVPFRFGDITVYLQVHVLRNPAYKVLLGRPFDILTASNVQNQPDGRQIVTITDPTTKQRCTLPTFERGALKNLKRMKPTVVSVPDESENVKPAAGNFQVHSMNWSGTNESLQQ